MSEGGAVADALAGAGAGGQQQSGGAQGGAGAGAGGDQGGGSQQGQQGGAEQQGRWQDKFLPEAMRADETLARYGSIEDLAKGHLETRTWAKGRVAIPGAEDAAGFEEFVGKVRPAKAEDYKIVDAEGKATETGEAFRKTFHDVGLHPLQAEKLNAAWNQYASDIASKTRQAGADELTAIELDLGTAAYHQRLAAVGNMFKAVGIDGVDLVPALEQVSGAGKAMQALFKLAESTGELGKVDGDQVALSMRTMTPEAAQQSLDAMMVNTDPEFQKRLRDPNSAEAQKRKALNAVVAKARAGGG